MAKILFVVAAASSALSAAFMVTLWFGTVDASVKEKQALSATPIPESSNDARGRQQAFAQTKAIVTMKPAISGGLAADLIRQTNGRAFVEHAKMRSKEGGVYYAVRFVRQCRGLISGARVQPVVSEATDGTLAAKVSEANSFQNRRCGDFASTELTDETLDALSRYGLEQSDPLMAAANALNKANIEDNMADMREAIAEFLMLKDPLLLSQDGVNLLRHKGALWFDNKAYPLEKYSLIQALQLAACDFGAECGPANILVSEACGLAQHCYHSLVELFRHENEPDAFAETLAFRKKIVTAVVQNNAEIFMPKQAAVDDHLQQSVP